MITMKEWMELVDYRITEGSDFGWQCYGSNVYQLDSWNGLHDEGGFSFCIVFDTRDHTVYEAQAHDYGNQRAYRMVNPDFAKKMRKEAKHRDVSRDQAWDDVNYVNLEVTDDFIQKCLAIKTGKAYDTRVEVPLTLDDSQLFDLMKLAHEADMSLNAFVEQILRDMIKTYSVE